MFTRNRFFLFLAPNHADLWRQRGRVLEKLATLSTLDSNYPTHLRQLFVAQKSHRVALLLNLPDLTVQAELTPAVGFLDRRKLIGKQLDYLFPRATLKGTRIGKQKTQLAALRPHATLTATLHAIVGTGAELDWIAHTALEAARIIPADLQASPYICALKLSDTGLLLAGEQGLLLAARHLPLAQLNGASLAGEIQSTFAYLQRHGWQSARDLAFIGFGIDTPTVPGIVFTRTALHPEADGYAELLAQLAQARRPVQPLTNARLRRRKYLFNLHYCLTGAAMTAALLVLCSFLVSAYLFSMLDDRKRVITEAMATLPPPLAIQDTGLLRKFQASLDAPLALAAVLPNDAIDGIAYHASPLESDEAPSLRLTATGAPALAGWDMAERPDTAPISGTIGKATKLQPDTYLYTWRAQP